MQLAETYNFVYIWWNVILYLHPWYQETCILTH
jgi:hypothetical protein